MCYASIDDFTPIYENFVDEEQKVFESNLYEFSPDYSPISVMSFDDESLVNSEVKIIDRFFGYDSSVGNYFEYYNLPYIAQESGMTTSEYNDFNIHAYDNEHRMRRHWEIRSADLYGSAILNKGQGVELSLNNFANILYIRYSSDDSRANHFYSYYYGNKADWWFTVYYTDGTYKSFTGDNYIETTLNHFTIKLDPSDKAVKYINVACSFDLDDLYPDAVNYYNSNYYMEFQLGCYNGSFELRILNEETGLLRGLLNWVKSIYETVINIPSKIGEVLSSIAELPQKIWTFISDGLKNLFVPSETKIEEFKTNFENLFAERFGALYESGQYITTFFENLGENDTQTSIEIPLVSVPLAGVDYTFGGYTVEIVPVKFKFLLDILKVVIDIIVTVAFINAMKKRFEDILGGEESSE